MKEFLPFLNIIGTLIGSWIVAWLSVLKFKREVKKEESKNDLLGMHEFFDANVKFRDEIRKDYSVIKCDLIKKTQEADDAWKQVRECRNHTSSLQLEISTMVITMKELECQFSEFRKTCEKNHRKDLI